ncbi:putative RNA methyltransferase [Gryllotalpicola koreensis]|uniref:Methyltransferase domain-containing protein n=1 Tax=Gryllotalpicola koreensis TaxID=993086 RepID=A0ABP7ZY53_9MICO
MSVQTLAAWLRCPNCVAELTDAGPQVLGCANGHRFDVNRRGYVTLLPPRSRVVGDSAGMLDARAELLASGAYAPIRDALIAAVRPFEPRKVLDSGTGTGWYLQGLLDALGGGARGLASDLSPAAVARALRGRADVDGLVADVHAPLPIRDGVTDAVTVVFAPRNPPEFARLLRPGGVLAVVVPRADHLAELRAMSPMLDVPAGKAGALEASVAPWFSPVSARHVRYELPLTADRAAQLQGMGPSAHHVGGALVDATALPASVTVSVDVLAFTRR